MNPIKRRWLLAGAGTLAAALGASLAWRRHAPDRADLAAAQPLWQAALTTPEGQVFVASRLQGRPLLVNFWATWCPPCVKELPEINRFYNEFKAANWQVLGIAVDSVEPVKAFLQKTPLDFPIAISGGAGVSVARQLGNLEGALPFSLILNEAGQITWRRLGETRLDELRGLARS